MDAGTVTGSGTVGWKIDQGLFQLGIAFLLLPGYFLLGAEFKSLMIPYALFLLFSTKAAYFPALLVHFLPGSIVSQMILVGCAILPLVKWWRLGRYSINMLYWVSVLPLLILGYVAGQKYFVLGYSWVEVADSLALYLGLFGFYYGVFIADQVNRTITIRVIWVLLISVLIQASGLVEVTIRYYFLAMPLLTTLAISFLFITRRANITLPILVSPLLFLPLVITGQLGVTFTLLMTTILAILLVFAHTHWRVSIRGLPIGKVLGILAILVTIYVVRTAGELDTLGGEARGLSSIETWGDILPTLEFKAFGDRGVLWVRAWDTLIRENNIWPPVQPPLLDYGLRQGRLLEVTFGAHNIGLELFRQYGFVVGFVGIVVYLAIIGYVGKIFASRTSSGLMLVIGAVLLATAVVGGLVGQFVLMNNFSFLLLGLAGVIYGSAWIQPIHSE